MRSRWSWRFLRRPRWLIGTLVVLVAAFVMIELGFWQIRRLHQRLQRNAAIERRMDAPAMPLAQALQRYDFTVPLGAPDSAAYRHVSVRGRYDPTAEVLLRSRSLGGHPGFDVLTPLELEGGRALLVDRGWVPYTDSDPPLPESAPPRDTVTLTGLLRDPDPLPSGIFKNISPRDPATGPLKKTFYANPQRLQAQMPFPLVNGYLQLLTQSPAQPGELPAAAGKPGLSNGPHLSYAIQWFSFTAILLGGFGAVFVKRAREPVERSEAGSEGALHAEVEGEVEGDADGRAESEGGSRRPGGGAGGVPGAD